MNKYVSYINTVINVGKIINNNTSLYSFHLLVKYFLMSITYVIQIVKNDNILVFNVNYDRKDNIDNVINVDIVLIHLLNNLYINNVFMDIIIFFYKYEKIQKNLVKI